MLAYDENGKLCEFEGNTSVSVFNKCHRLYRSFKSEQIPGFREREYDFCPYCGYENDSSMTYEYSNSILNNTELQMIRKKSLYTTITKYCHEEYKSSTCEDCNHNIQCPGSPCGNCKQCLEEVHYPTRYSNGRRDYDCDRMMYFYVCDYTSKYASEMLYLMRESEALKKIDNYHVLSLGCGACPDLIAFEQFCHELSAEKTVQYIGIDVNERWRSIHEKISEYKTKTLKKTQFRYCDVVTEDIEIHKVNVIVLQYIISHFYNTGQIKQINEFFIRLIDEIICHKQEENPLVILINDVNSNNRGRDYFSEFVTKLKEADFHGIQKGFYFDYRIQNDFQKYGTKHASCQTVFEIPREYETIYSPWHYCSSAQLLIEVN